MTRALDYARQARELSKAQGYDDGYAEGLLLVGQTLKEGGEDDIARIALDSARRWALYIRDQARAKGEPRREARAVRQLAFRYESLRQWGEAEKMFLELLQLYRTMGYPYQHYTFERLSVIQMLVHNYNKSLYYILEALKSMERTGDDSQAANFYFDLGYTYCRLDQAQQGLNYLKKSYDLYARASDPILFDVASEIVEALAKMGKAAQGLELIEHTLQKFTPKSRYNKRVIEDAYATCYRVLGRYDLADLHLKKATVLVSEHHPFYMYEVMATGQLYQEWGKFDSARPYPGKKACIRIYFRKPTLLICTSCSIRSTRPGETTRRRWTTL